MRSGFWGVCGLVVLFAAGGGVFAAQGKDAQGFTAEQVDAYWKSGRTLPVEASEQYRLPALRIQNDTGINVLVDMAHKCDFFTMWNLSGALHRRGIRTAGSHATLDSVIKPGSLCRVRVPVGGKLHPFAWWRAAKFNVVMTQGGASDPAYLPQECEAVLAHVRAGGGLIVSGVHSLSDEDAARAYSLNKLLKSMGAAFAAGTQRYKGRRVPKIEVDERWDISEKGEGGEAVVAKRSFGKGHAVLLASHSLFRFDRMQREETQEKGDFLADLIKWAAAGSPAAGGEARLPAPMAGGGGIYPEQEARVQGIVVYYSKNQIPVLLKTVREDFPAITEQLYAWYPSEKPEEPMYLILGSSGGGGWAVNAYLPKEVGTITTRPNGLRSIFGHEQAHTMAGPCTAGNHPFGGNRGEEHAGWYQGKVIAQYEKKYGPNRGCDGVLRKDAAGPNAKPEAIFKPSHLEKWKTGHDRLMIWYVWNKFDDRYGPMWYPRWRWVQQQRWAGEPGRKLTWEESITDMSIAVGEDLFGFFAKTGKELSIKRLEEVEFMGETIKLPVAPIEPTRPGGVNLDPIGDFTKPIKLNSIAAR